MSNGGVFDSQKSPPLIVSMGEILWDLLPAGKQLGGASANFAWHAHSLGARAVVISRVGTDSLGQEILNHLKHIRLNQQFIQHDPVHATGTVTVELDALGKPTYIIHEQVAWDYIACNQEILSLAGQADAVCIGSLAQRSSVSRETIQRFLSATRPECLRVFDVNLRQSYYSKELIIQMLSQCQLLKLNDEELPILAGMLGISEMDALPSIMNHYQSLRWIALTRGKSGSLLYTRQESSDLPATSDKVVDTVGAGDAFTATLTVGLLRHLSLETAHRWARQIAGFVCSQPGAMPTLPECLRRDFATIKA